MTIEETPSSKDLFNQGSQNNKCALIIIDIQDFDGMSQNDAEDYKKELEQRIKSARETGQDIIRVAIGRL